MSDTTDTATHNSCSDDGQPDTPTMQQQQQQQQEQQLSGGLASECGWEVTHAPKPSRWTVLQSSAGEPRVRLPPAWQQRYMQMGERLVAPVEVDAQRPRKVAVVGPIGQVGVAVVWPSLQLMGSGAERRCCIEAPHGQWVSSGFAADQSDETSCPCLLDCIYMDQEPASLPPTRKEHKEQCSACIRQALTPSSSRLDKACLWIR